MKLMGMEVLIVSHSIMLSTINTFLCCYVGSSTTDLFLRYADISYESLWYNFPTKLQQYLRLIIADAQRPRVFQGLAIIDLNLTLFTMVMFCF